MPPQRWGKYAQRSYEGGGVFDNPKDPLGLERRDRRYVERRDREARFARLYVNNVVRGMDRKAAAIAAVVQAGFRMKALNGNGTVNGVVRSKAREMLKLPRIQSQVMEVLAEQGASLELVGQTLAQAMTSAPDYRDRISAADLVIRTTVGHAPTKSFNVNAGVKADKFFDAERFENPGPPKLE